MRLDDAKYPRWWGPKLTAGFFPAGLDDYGCRRHPRPRTGVTWLLAELFAPCGCVTRFQWTIEWWWGRIGWVCPFEANWLARLHPRYVAPHTERPISLSGD